MHNQNLPLDDSDNHGSVPAFSIQILVSEPWKWHTNESSGGNALMFN